MNNKKDYSEDWCDIIRPNILKRDYYRCVHCGIRHKQYVFRLEGKGLVKIDKDEMKDYKDEGYRVYRIYLQVAHIDNNKNNNNENNLISLCVTCHSFMDRENRKIMRMANTKIKCGNGIYTTKK